MENTFSQNLVLLRKERGYSQKRVAADLHISQALLSHYEKGIRECGLGFVLRVSDYFGVTCDFLLGKTVERQGGSAETTKPSADRTLLDTIPIVFGILKKINSKSLTKEVAQYLHCALYTVLRLITKGGQDLFALDKDLYAATASAKMTMCKAKAHNIIVSEALQEKLPELRQDAPLQELIKKAESNEQGGR